LPHTYGKADDLGNIADATPRLILLNLFAYPLCQMNDKHLTVSLLCLFELNIEISIYLIGHINLIYWTVNNYVDLIFDNFRSSRLFECLITQSRDF
jgi:hypothetical protein